MQTIQDNYFGHSILQAGTLMQDLLKAGKAIAEKVEILNKQNRFGWLPFNRDNTIDKYIDGLVPVVEEQLRMNRGFRTIVGVQLIGMRATAEWMISGGNYSQILSYYRDEFYAEVIGRNDLSELAEILKAHKNQLIGLLADLRKQGGDLDPENPSNVMSFMVNAIAKIAQVLSEPVLEPVA